MVFNPLDWYWIDASGRVYSSKRQVIVDPNDSGYKAFVAAGNRATAWPRDDGGAQSDQALQDVLTDINNTRGSSLYLPTPVGLAWYAGSVRYAKETQGVTFSGRPIATDDGSQSKLTAAVLGAQVVMSEGGTFSTTWKCSDGSFLPLDFAGLAQLATGVLTYVNQCFAAESAIDAGIKASPPTITTFAQIDGFAWPSNAIASS